MCVGVCVCAGARGDVHRPEAAVTQQLSQTGTLKLTGCLPSARSRASYRCQVDVIRNVSEFIAQECKKKTRKQKTAEARREVEPAHTQLQERRGKMRLEFLVGLQKAETMLTVESGACTSQW